MNVVEPCTKYRAAVINKRIYLSSMYLIIFDFHMSKIDV